MVALPGAWLFGHHGEAVADEMYENGMVDILGVSIDIAICLAEYLI